MKVLCGISIGLLVLLSIGMGDAMAYREYALGCQNCHGDFTANNYVSNVDDQAWGTSLHNGHRFNFLDGDCATCHTSPNRTPVYLASSDGGDGLAPLGCIGCHGRDEGTAGVTGMGLRQHHWNSGVAVCLDCHDDSDPGNFTPVDEVVLPPYYANPGNNHPNMPTHPCNLGSLGYPEDVLGAAGTGGLDNNGDGFYDTDDLSCAPLSPAQSTTWGQIKALYK